MRELFSKESESSRQELFFEISLDNYDNSPYIYGIMSYYHLNIEDHQNETTIVG